MFDEWSLPLTLATVIAGCLYTRGWYAIRRTRPAQFDIGRLAFFLLGLLMAWIAVASPLDEFADALLSAHMVQHLLLLSVVPPLLLLGWPAVPMLRGLPILRSVVRIRGLRRLGSWLISPVVAWIVMNLIFLAWHVPAAYDFALEHEHWHQFEHVSLLTGSLLFWWCILQPWPTRRRRDRWRLVVALLAADLVNTALSAFLAFCDRPVYLYYFRHPNPFHISPLSDQVLGAAIMWVGGSFAFLVPAALITFRILQPQRAA